MPSLAADAIEILKGLGFFLVIGYSIFSFYDTVKKKFPKTEEKIAKQSSEISKLSERVKTLELNYDHLKSDVDKHDRECHEEKGKMWDDIKNKVDKK